MRLPRGKPTCFSGKMADFWMAFCGFSLAGLYSPSSQFSDTAISSLRVLNKNYHRSGGAVEEGSPYLCLKHIIKLKKKKNCLYLRNKKNERFVIIVN